MAKDEKDEKDQKDEKKAAECNRCKAVVKKPVKRNSVNCCPECFAPLSWQA